MNGTYDRIAWTPWAIGVPAAAGAALGVAALLAGAAPDGAGWTGPTVENARLLLLATAVSLSAILGCAVAAGVVASAAAASRFAPRLGDLFVEDRAVRRVIGAFAAAILLSLFAAASMRGGAAPAGALLWLPLLAAAACVGLVAPFARHLGRLARPEGLAALLSARALAALDAIPADRTAIEARVSRFLGQVAELTHVAVAGIRARNAPAVLSALSAIGDCASRFQERKKKLPPAFFGAAGPEFHFLDPRGRERVSQNRTATELAILRGLDLCFAEASAALPGMAPAAAAAARSIGERAQRDGDTEAVRLVMRQMNTFLRRAVQQGAPRVFCDTAFQYRLLAESLVPAEPTLAQDALYFLKYYAVAAEDRGVSRVTDFVAFELNAVAQTAAAQGSPAAESLVDGAAGLEARLRDVRHASARRSSLKAAALLGAGLLHAGHAELSRRVAGHLRAAPGVPLADLREELLSVTEPEYWEATDRVANVQYLDPERREKLREFFTSLGAGGRER